MLKQIDEKWKRALISAFVLFHIYIMAVWGLPGSTFRYFLAKPVEDYVIFTGLWHSWDMFSPDPLAINFNLKAEITYQNGVVRTWTFPRMEKLGYWDRFQKERFRKWRERVRMDMYSVIWDDTARYVARINDTPTNHPVQVSLIREWQPIPMPANEGGKTKIRDYQPMLSPDPAFQFNYHFHFYNLRRGDL